MAAEIFDGKAKAYTIEENLKLRIDSIKQKRGHVPGLLSVLIGNDEASVYFTNLKQKRAEAIGMHFESKRYPETFDPREVVSFIHEKNEDKQIDGIIVQLPLPPHFDRTLVLKAIDPIKDVDGLHPKNLGFLLEGSPKFIPPAVLAVEEVLNDFKNRNSEYEIKSKEVVLVGSGLLIGKPIALYFLNLGSTVTLCNSHTSDLSFHTKRADIIVASTGEVELIDSSMVKDGSVLIDFGGKKIDGMLKGEFTQDVVEKASLITPVPGGVGPLTVAKLLENTVISAEQRTN